MALTERAVALFLLISFVHVSEAAIYRVGDSAGWTTIGNINYTKWAANKNFQIGDTIIFEYKPEYHNVMRVTHDTYRVCNASAPLATFTSGNDSIKITTYGHHFFVCGIPGHCEAGQKVDINVIHNSNDVAPSSSPNIAPTANAPSPSSNAAPLITQRGAFSMLGLGMTVFGIAASTILV